MKKEYSRLFQDPKTRHPIYDLNLPFSTYIEEYKHIIRTTRIDLQQNVEEMIAANSPFELQPKNNNKKTGALLIHGLLESPFIMKDIAEHLRNQGMLVRGILLPGHGTVPGSLLNINYQEWIQAVRYGIATLQNEVEKIYLVGASTGAILALYHALHHAKIAGVVLISPAIKIRSKLDFSSNWHRIISWTWERAKWLHIEEENDYAKYQSMPFNAAFQVYRLTRVIKKLSKTHQVKCPLFFALSMADSTVSAQASINYFQHYLRPDNRMLIYSSKMTHQNDPNTLVRCSVYPDMHIRELSHIALPVAPNNPHYGIHGDYVNASHIDEKNSDIIYGAFNKLENKIYDFLYKSKLTPIQRRRLTFNPDFDFLMQEIIQFCEK